MVALIHPQTLVNQPARRRPEVSAGSEPRHLRLVPAHSPSALSVGLRRVDGAIDRLRALDSAVVAFVVGALLCCTAVVGIRAAQGTPPPSSTTGVAQLSSSPAASGDVVLSVSVGD